MIAGFTPLALNQLADAIGGGGVVAVIDFSRLSDEIAALRQTSERIADSIENPSWVAGDELCRRSAVALRHGLDEDAKRDAALSIEAYPYRAAPHLFLGLAELQLGDAVASLESFELAIKYGAIAEAPHAATAGLLACNLAAAVGNAEKQVSLLEATSAATNRRCPAVEIAMNAIQPNGVSGDELSKLLIDDPYAWNGFHADDSHFGGAAKAVRSEYCKFIDAIDAFVTCAEAFESSSERAEFRDAISSFWFESVGYKTAEFIESCEGTRESIHLRPLLAKIAGSQSESSLPEVLAFGVLLTGWMVATDEYSDHYGDDDWRSWMERSIEDGSLSSPAFDEIIRLRDSVYTDAKNCQIGIRDDGTVWTHSRRYFVERLAAARQSFDQAIAWASHAVAEEQEVPAPTRPAALGKLPGKFGRKEQFAQTRYEVSQKRIAANVRLDTIAPPPNVAELFVAMSNWVEMTKPSGDSVIVPFAEIAVPDLSSL